MTQMTFVKDEKPEDLVLKQSRISKFDWSKYSNFIEELCKDREYQKEAIKSAVNLFLGKQYKNTQDLAEENWELNSKIREYHKNKEDFLNQFEFPDKLCCTLDLATGTGKSWAMYGVAQIMLCEGIIDQVLVLVPNTTIEEQLKDKFLDFSSDGRLKKTLPKNSKYKNPRIISADMTIMPGDICVENDDAILEHVTSSSIIPSLKGKGHRTLIINDEAHHLISDDKNDPKWNQFIRDPNFDFFFILNSTGTPYKGNTGNNYFRDVIYRYSIRKAIDECYIKDIKYLTEDEGKGKDKLSLVYAVHEDNRKKYSEIKKPLTIFISGRIAEAESYSKEFEKFLIKRGISQENAQKKILVVSSKHKENNDALSKVDASESPVEYIFSVSKLSEGWDVKNVFQIVPHEERAFNSKLLISQVLGRGLRIPLPYLGNRQKQPIVTINNHDSWSKNISSYVDAVAEIDRLVSYPTKRKPDYNFEVFWADSTKEIRETSKKVVEKGSISLPKEFIFQTQSTARAGKFKEVKEGKEEYINYDIELNAQKVGDVATQIITKLKDYDSINKTNYCRKTSLDQIKEMLKKALKKVGAEDIDYISDENRQRALNAYSTLFREETKTSVVEPCYKKPGIINTFDIQKTYVSVRSMDKDRAIVYDKKSLDSSEEEDKKAVEKFYKEYNRPHGAVIIAEGSSEYKCPLNLSHVSHKNELEFARRLIEKNNSKNYDSWVKLPDQGFYEIEYSFRPGSHSLTRKFNPDFLIKKGKSIIVVEIKSDDDTKEVNVAKNKYAEKYFKQINSHLEGKQRYTFNFLSPEDFTNFFDALKNNNSFAFVSGLQASLREKQK